MKLPVTKTGDETEWLCFEEVDIRKQCIAECGTDQTEECIDGMKVEGVDCVAAYLNLILTDCDFVYKEMSKEG